MERINPWPLLRGEKAEQVRGLQQLQEAHAHYDNGSTIMELGVAYLWLHQYERAWEHFHNAIETFHIKGDAFYGMAGVAKWCLGKPDEAVAEWRGGLTAAYARASGLAVQMPLLLFFAAIREPGISDRTSAEQLLRELTTDRRIRNWPGPLARLILDDIGETEFHDHCLGIRPGDTGKNPFARHSQQEISNCLWLADFYRNVLALKQSSSLSDVRRAMRKLSDTSQQEWQDENHVFTVRIWCEEFFLARYEAGRSA